MPTISKKRPRPGDEVNLRLGKTLWRAKIIEDRGPIGIEGRQIFRLQLLDGEGGEPQSIEAPAELLERVGN